MKKIILTALLLTAAFSTSAFAAFSSFTGATTLASGSMSFNSSNKVHLGGASASTGYVVEALHASGSRVFATDQVASVIYWKDATIAATAPSSSFTAATAPTASTAHGTPALPGSYTAL